MSNTQIPPQAYPLQWPEGWPRVEKFARESWKPSRDLSKCLSELRREISLMGGTDLVLSSSVTLGAERPADPGVVAYFMWQKQQMAIPCDRWDSVAGNVRAITLTVEAMRGLERWGAKHMIHAMFNGFKRLSEKASGVSWWEVLGVSHKADAAEIKRAYVERAKVCHPDKGGSESKMIELNEAYSAALNQNGRAAA